MSIFSVLWRIYSRLYRDKNVEFHKLMSMSSSVLTETTANSKKSWIFLNFQYCKWKNKYTNKLYFSLKTIQFEMSAFLLWLAFACVYRQVWLKLNSICKFYMDNFPVSIFYGIFKCFLRSSLLYHWVICQILGN